MAARTGLKGIRIGVPHDQFMSMMEPEVGAAIQDALGVSEKSGRDARQTSASRRSTRSSVHIGRSSSARRPPRTRS